MDDRVQALAQRLTTEWAPEALRMALSSIQWEASAAIIRGIVSLAFLIGCILLVVKAKRKFDEHDDEFQGLVLVGSSFGALVSLIATLINLADPWVYIALYDPRLYLAHQILQSLSK
jgi:hypothetical protein